MDIKPVTDFFNGGYGGRIIPSADDIIQGRLGYSAYGGKPVYRY